MCAWGGWGGGIVGFWPMGFWNKANADTDVSNVYLL